MANTFCLSFINRKDYYLYLDELPIPNMMIIVTFVSGQLNMPCSLVVQSWLYVVAVKTLLKVQYTLILMFPFLSFVLFFKKTVFSCRRNK